MDGDFKETDRDQNAEEVQEEKQGVIFRGIID